MRCDLHCHTRYSHDSLAEPRSLVRTALRRGLKAIAVTDHECFAACEEVRRAVEGTGLFVIPGMEVRTEIGDVIGLFLTREIAARRFHDVVAEIHDQSGLVLLPHPFHHHQLTGIDITVVDAIEVFNGRCTPEQNRRALDLAAHWNKPGTFGSDAHWPWELGRGWCDLDAVAEAASLTAGIRKGALAIHGKRSSRANVVLSQLVKRWKKYQRAMLPSPSERPADVAAFRIPDDRSVC